MRVWRRDGDDILTRELLLATGPTDLQHGEQVLPGDTEVGVVGTTTAEGVPVLPVFTSERRLVEWKPEGSPFLGLQGRDVLALFLRGDWQAIVIDPTEPTGRKLDRDEAARLLGLT